jgi:PAS domain S-box-containing protein
MDDQPKILVVHHERVILTLITDLLGKNGFETREVETGIEAIETAREYHPDLILLTIMLPDLDWSEVLEELQVKNDPDLRVILISRKDANKNELERGLALGANDTITWPVSNSELLAHIRSVLRLRQSELALRTSEEGFRAHFEHLPLAYQSLDETGHILNVNQVWLELLGYRLDEVIGRSFAEFVIPDQRERIKKHFTEFKQKGQVHDVEFDLLTSIGDSRTVLINGNISYDSQMAFKQTHCVLTDITERKKAEQQQAHSRDLLSYVIENIASSIAIFDKDMRYLYVSQHYLADYHTTETDIIGKLHYEVYPDIPQKFREAHQSALNGKIVCAEEDAFIRNDGEVIWTRWECRPWYETDGSIGGIILNSEVITDQVKARHALEESERKYRLLIENTDLGISYFDLQGNLLFLNPAAVRMMNGQPEQYFGKNVFNFHAEGYAKQILERIQQAAETKDTLFYEDQIPFLDEAKWINSRYTRVVDETGSVQGVQVIVEDITKRKQAEQALKASEEKFRLVFDYSNVGKSLTLPTGEVRANQALCNMLGYSPEELARKTWQMLSPPEDVDWISAILAPLLNGTQDSTRFIRRYICKDGSIKWGDVSTVMRRDEQGKPMHFISTVVDITDRKNAEESLQQTTQLLSLFIHNSPIYAYIKEVTPTESRVVFASENYIDMIGIPGSKMVGKTMEELFPREFAAKISADDWIVVSKGETLKLDEELNGRSYITLKFPITLGSRKLLAGYTVDITEIKHTEIRLKELNRRQEALLGAIPDILMETDLNKVYSWANPAGLNFFGEDVIGHEAADYFIGKQDAYQKVDALFHGDERTTYVESWQRRRDGEKRLLAWWCRVLLDAEGKPIGALSTARDITEKKMEEDQIRDVNIQLEERVAERTRELREAQEQIVRKEKLAFLGQLAGSVGHELRNPLAVIANAVYYLRMINKNADEKETKYLNIIESETRDAEKIISDLLEFARTKNIERTTVEVGDLVKRGIEHCPAPENIQVLVEIPKNLPDVFVDPRHIVQIIENLFINAYQAMPEGGKIQVNARTATKKGGKEVDLVVKDSGIGIAKENLAKLFEPLFTTKPQGIGLGLAVSKKLIEANEGTISVKSEVGKGTEFILHLPVVQEVK